MALTRLLVVEDDVDIAKLLRYYFMGLGYQVDVASRGQQALELTRQVMPHLIILDIVLPDMDGFDICRTLRQHTRTSHIPVIFLTQKDERSNRLQGLELGADDYITKPFDIEELRLRVQNALVRAERERLTDPVTCLPAGPLIEAELKNLLAQMNWAVLDVRMNNLEYYRIHQGQAAAQNVLQGLAAMLGAALDQNGENQDFLGHAGGANFILITGKGRAASIAGAIKGLFGEKAGEYTQVSEQVGAENIPLTLSVGVVTASEGPFPDIRTITELAAEARRRDNPAPNSGQR